MPDLEVPDLAALASEHVSQLHQEIARLQTQLHALQAKYVQTQAKFAQLLQTAYAYRDAHAAMKQDVRRLLPGEPPPGFSRDEPGIRARTKALCSAQAVLFVAIDTVQEKTEQA